LHVVHMVRLYGIAFGCVVFFFQAEDGIRDFHVTGVQTCALPIWVLGPMLADGLLLTEGEQWRRQRRIMAPLFTPAYTARTAEIMDGVCRRRVEGWRLPHHGARVLHIDSEMSGLTFDILSATRFSDELHGDAAGL